MHFFISDIKAFIARSSVWILLCSPCHHLPMFRHSSGLMNKRNVVILIVFYPRLQITSSCQFLGHLGKIAFCIYNGSRFPDSLQETFDRITVTVPFSLLGTEYLYFSLCFSILYLDLVNYSDTVHFLLNFLLFTLSLVAPEQPLSEANFPTTEPKLSD